MNDNGILLASGGLDSTTLAYYLLDKGIEIIPLFIDYGQHCARTELATLKRVLPYELLEKVEQINVSQIYRSSESRFIKEPDLWKENITSDDLYIPYRNILLLTIGASFAQTLGYRKVYSAFINSNHAKEIDCSSEFFEKMSDILVGYGAVKIMMPFRDYSKQQVVRIGYNLGVPLGVTYSCQASPDIPCGACPNCVDRLSALKELDK